MTATIIRKPPTQVTVLRRSSTSATVTTAGGVVGPRGARGHGSFATLDDVVDWSTRAEGDVPVVDVDGNLRPGQITGTLPPGGTTGQVLTKESDADSDADWEDPAGAGSGSPTGPAGGVLAGTYPDPDFAADMATQAELQAGLDLKVDDHDGSHSGALEVHPDLGEIAVVVRPDRKVSIGMTEDGLPDGAIVIAAATDAIPDVGGVPGVGAYLELLGNGQAIVATDAHQLKVDVDGVKVDDVLLDDLYDAEGAAVAGDAAHVAATDPHTQYQKESERGASNGYAPLDASSLLPTANLPPLAITSVTTVADQAAMLALNAQDGDVAYRLDNSSFYILATTPASTLANWKQLTAPGTVVSVDGRTGVITLSDLYDALGAATSAVSTHTAASDPHGDRAFATAADATAAALKVSKAGDSMTGDLAMGTHRVTGLSDGASAQDAATKAQVDAATATVTGKVAKAGDTMTGPLVVSADPVADLQAVGRRYVDAGAMKAASRLGQLLLQDIRDTSILLLGDSTTIPYGFQSYHTQWPGIVMDYVMALYPKTTFQHKVWDDTGHVYGSATVDQTGSGGSGRTCTFYFASVSGTRLDNLIGSSYANAVTGTAPDLILVSHGHNEGDTTDTANGTTQQTVESFRARYDAALERIHSDWPMAGVILIGQNASIVGTDTYAQDRKSQAVASIAGERGYGFVDVCQAWWDIAGTAAAGTYSADGVHPTVPGHGIYADAIKPLFALDGYTPRGGVKPAKPSERAAWNLFNNGNFALWNTVAGPPDGGVATNATVTQDTTHYLDINRPASMRIQASSAAASFVTFPILNAFDMIPTVWDNAWVTAIGWRRIPAGQDIDEAGRIGLDDGVNVQRSQGKNGPFDDFAPISVSIKISPSATKLDLILYGDSGAHGSADVSWDHVVVVPGIVAVDRIPPLATLEANRLIGNVDAFVRGGRVRVAAADTIETAASGQSQVEVRRLGDVKARSQMVEAGVYWYNGTAEARASGIGIAAGPNYDRAISAFVTEAAQVAVTTTNADYSMTLSAGGFANTNDWYKTILMATTNGTGRTVTVPELTAPGAIGKFWVRRAGPGTVTVAPANANVLFYFADGRASGASVSFAVKPYGLVQFVRNGLSGWIVTGDVMPNVPPPIYGNGITTTTISGTTSLTEDLHADVLTVTGTLVVSGQRVFCRRLVGNGVIHADGGAGGATGTAGATVANGFIGSSTAGGAGGTAAGSAGSNIANATGVGAIGGAGGLGASGAGGAAGTYSAIQNASNGTPTASLLDPNQVRTGRISPDGATTRTFAGGSGGGGGGGDGTAGGGGGGGGGVCLVYVYDATEWTGTIRANGGAGGSPATGNRGGGGGGGGGLAAFVYTWAPVGAYTVQANGGAQGVKQGTGVNGTAGTTGNTIDKRLTT